MTANVAAIYTHIHGSTMSIVLIMMVLFETLLVLDANLRKYKKWMSKSLIVGFLVHIAYAFIPFGLDLFVFKNVFIAPSPEDLVVVRVFTWGIFLIVSIGMLGSILANVAVAFPNFWPVVRFVEKYLPEEYQSKLNKIEKSVNDLTKQ